MTDPSQTSTQRVTFGSVQIAMLKALEELEGLPPGSLSAEHRRLLEIYSRQMIDTLRDK